MKCPLWETGKQTPNEISNRVFRECLKEECAWWVKASESCAMEAIPRIIGYLGSELKVIKEKMPFKGQFTK